MDGCSFKWMNTECDISHSDSHNVFRSLFTFIVLVQLFVSLIHAAPSQRLIGRDNNKGIRPSISKSLNFEKDGVVHLLNNKHKGYLEILGKRGGVNVKGLKSSTYARIRMHVYKSKDELDKDDYVQLQGNSTRAYMCFTRRGKLVAKYDKPKRWRCFFTLHRTQDDHFEFRSAANPDWIVNFNRDGKPSRYTSTRNRRRKKSAQFLITIADTKQWAAVDGISGFLNPTVFIHHHNKQVQRQKLDIRDKNGRIIRHAHTTRRSSRQTRSVIASTERTRNLHLKPTFENT